MDEQPPGGAELPEPGEEDASGQPGGPYAPSDAVAGALAEEAAEIRRMVEAGAGSPEAIRDLAERLRQHRQREEALWRAEVRPALVKQGRGRLRGPRGDREPSGPAGGGSSQPLWLGLGLLLLVAVVVVAANTTPWVLVLPVLALVVWAWVQGRDHPHP